MRRSHKQNKISCLLFAILISIGCSAPQMIIAQKTVLDIKLGEEITFFSDILGQPRQILVSKPDYDGTLGKKIPVLYVLDGSNHFKYTTGIISFLSAQKRIPPVLVVAIRNIDRNKDFTPVSDTGKPNSGGATNFHAFIDQELIPFIDKNYYTSDYRILLGHSLGGMFATWSMLNYPGTFDAYISISPYLQWADELLLQETIAKIPDAFNSPKFLYMTLGNEPEYTDTHSRFLSILKEKGTRNFEYRYMVMEKEDHASVPLISVYLGLLEIFGDWQLPEEKYLNGVVSIDEHNRYLSDKYGMDIATDELTINLLGYTYLRSEDYEKAIRTLEENVRRFPKSANVYDSLGDAYKLSGNLVKAKENYQKAVRLGQKQNSPFLNTYIKNLESVE